MREYKAFISYRHAPLDIAVATRLHRMIEHYRVPAEFAKEHGSRLGYVFRDQDELPVTSDLSANIRQALDHSRFLIVVCTPETPKSIWVDREIRYFLRNHDRDHILAVLADGRPEEAFPGSLIHIYDEAGNIVEDAEPLAANIADPASDRRRVMRRLDREVLRIYAALLGCSFDALYQRERRYRARRLAAIGGLALAVAVAYIALLLVKNRQITAQNAELIEQKRQIQLNEALLLSKDAADALESGDYVTAMRTAIEALPTSAEDSRPYRPEAERALLDATNLFDTSVSLRTYQRLLDTASVEMAAPVHDMVFNQSGTVLYTIDDYGNLFAVDALAGRVLWQKQVMEDASKKPDCLQIRLYEAQGCLLVFEKYFIACLDLEDGAERWRRSKVSGPDLFVLDAEHDRIATVVFSLTQLDDGTTKRDYWLMVLRAGTGETLHRVKLMEDDSDLSLSASANYSPDKVRQGVFFNDGKSFACFLYAYQENEICYFVADLEAGSCRLLRKDPYDDGTSAFHMEITPNGEALAVFRRSENGYVAARIHLIRMADGELIAEGQTGEEEKAVFFSNNAAVHVLRAELYAIFSVVNYMYVVDLQTAQCLGGVKLYATPTSVQWLDSDMFSFTLENGYHAVGWLSEDHRFNDTQSYGFAFNIGANTRSTAGNRGFIRPRVVDGSVRGFECGTPGAGFGCIAMVPDGASHRVDLVRLLPALRLPPWQVLDVPGADGSIVQSNGLPGLRLCGDAAIALECQRADGKSIYRLAKIDLATGAVENTALNTDDYVNNCWLFSDAKGAFDVVDIYGKISRLDLGNGEITDVTTPSNVLLSSEDGVKHVGHGTRAACCYLSADGRLLTAWCDGAKLRWWLDGEAQVDVPLPDGLTWQVADSSMYCHVLAPAPSGLIVLSDFGADPDCGHMTGFAAYDVFSGRWMRAEDLGRGSADRRFACADVKARFAALDADGMLRAYDLEAGGALCQVPVNLPLSYVVQMRFILDDGFILLRMEDNQYAIYSVETGECACRGTLDWSYRSQTFACLDGNGRRVVLIDTATNKGVLLDRESWTELGRFDNACAYDPGRDELYCLGYQEENGRYALQRRRIPDLWELIDIVKDSVGKE